MDELESMAANNGVDAISITETWLSDSSPDPLLHDFTLFRKDRIPQRGNSTFINSFDKTKFLFWISDLLISKISNVSGLVRLCT